MKMEVDDDHRRRMEQQRVDEQRRLEQQKRPEEPAARKMDVDEDYDEESDKGSVKNGHPGAGLASGGSSRASPKTVHAAGPNNQQNGVINGGVRVEGV